MTAIVDDQKIDRDTLLKRGWTDEAIALHLPKQRRHSLLHVREVEKIPAVAQVLAGHRGRVEAVRVAAQIDRENIFAWIDQIEVNIPVMPIDQLVQDAIEHYNDRGDEFGKNAHLHKNSETYCVFLERIACNYLRHGCGNYEESLEMMKTKISASELAEDAYQRIKARFNGEIERVYPKLWSQIKDFLLA
jgi:hypothetical protein